MTQLTIKKDDLTDGQIEQLLHEHRQEMLKYSPPESVHALDTKALRAPNLTFWSAWMGNEFAACGALKELDPAHGEIKSMRTKTAFLRQGIAARMMVVILSEARDRGYRRVSLETGSMDEFKAARALYQGLGFVPCPPFGDYFEDPLSLCMTLELS